VAVALEGALGLLLRLSSAQPVTALGTAPQIPSIFPIVLKCSPMKTFTSPIAQK